MSLVRSGALLIALSLLGARSAQAGSVIVFPLDARGVSYDTASSATEWVLGTIRSIEGTEVIEPKTVEQEIGVKLTEQARACDYDVFCLVEVGEILQGDRMLIGHVRLVSGKEEEKHELKLIVLDVPKATIVEVLIWKIPTARPGGLEGAVRTATRRLFGKPDALVDFDLEPKDARLYFYGDPVQVPEDGSAMPYWSGTYLAVAEAEGYHPKELRVVIPPAEPGGAATRIPIRARARSAVHPPDGQKAGRALRPGLATRGERRHRGRRWGGPSRRGLSIDPRHALALDHRGGGDRPRRGRRRPDESGAVRLQRALGADAVSAGRHGDGAGRHRAAQHGAVAVSNRIVAHHRGWSGAARDRDLGDRRLDPDAEDEVMRFLLLIVVLAAACGLEERTDFLIGRQCDRNRSDCDPGAECLPHKHDPFADFRCRDRASFEPIDNQEAPLAYCNADIACPGDLVCNADRIREGTGRRLMVCKRPDDVFAPPLEGD